MQEMISIFLEESQDHLQALNDNLLLLEKDPEAIEIVGDIFRSAHTFKGMAATMEFHQMASLTHKMENVLDEIRHGNLPVTTEIIDIIFECTDILEKMVSDVQQGGTGNFDVSAIIVQLEAVLNNEAPTAKEENPKNKNTTYTLKIVLSSDVQLKAVRSIMCVEQVKEYGEIVSTIPSVERLEAEEFEKEFTITFTLSEDKYISELQNTIKNIGDVEEVILVSEVEETKEIINRPIHTDKSTTDVSRKNTRQKAAVAKVENKSIRVQLEKIEQLMNVFEESVVERGRIEEIAQHMRNKDLIEHLNRLGDISKDIQNLLLNMRMVPIDTVFNRYPKMVRTLAKDLGKKIDLIITGEDTEVDKIVIDEIGDPLVHLIRNAVDHGIETVEKRKAVGKSETGTVRLEAFHSGNNVVIQVSEDGAGINKENVIRKAVKNNIISDSEAAKLLDHEVYDLIFKPGFSTAEVISNISGRGVGLDVVKTTITKLGGTLSVTSEPGNGSVFRIEIPLTLSIIQAMLVTTSETRYAMPLANVVEAMKIDNEEFQIINDKKVINYREQIIEILELDEIFHEEKRNNDPDATSILIIKNTNRTYGLAINNIIGQREVVLKSLGDFFVDSVKFFSGATILGDGHVVLVLDPDSF